jgi:GntR family transcriptional regulator
MKVMLRRLRVRLNRADAPAHAAIEEGLAEAMAIGELTSGERLPAERELAERLGVSRMTLRQALGSLERRGLVKRRVGRRGGTFVSEPKIERDLTALAGLTAQLRRQGHRAGARVISAGEGPASGRTAAALGVEPGAPVYRVVRLRLSDDQPLALERSLFPAVRFPGLLLGPLDGSLYAVLEERYGDGPVRAVESLEPVVAEASEATLLGVREGAPLLLVERTAFDQAGHAIEYARDLFRGDRTKVVVESSAAVRPSVSAQP